MKLRVGLVICALLAGGAGYVRLPASGEPPVVTQFAASRTPITAGESAQLTWALSGDASARLLSVDKNVPLAAPPYRVAPTLSDSYTLLAQNRAGSDQRTLLVQVDAPTGGAPASGGAAPDAGLPEGGIGVSLDPQGPFVNDEESDISSPGDARVVRVAPGGTFFAEVAYTDPDGIGGVELYLANGRPEGLAGPLLPDRPPFTVVGAPTGDCRLGRLPTVVRCVFRVQVAEDARNISALPGAGDEFAYVFRSRASDGQGNSVNREVRGYVLVME